MNWIIINSVINERNSILLQVQDLITLGKVGIIMIIYTPILASPNNAFNNSIRVLSAGGNSYMMSP